MPENRAPLSATLLPTPGKAQSRTDGLMNALTGFGGAQDPTTANYYQMEAFRPDEELSSMWVGAGLARKICSCRPDDMLRAWISFPEDTDGKILDALDALDIRTHLKDLLAWTELYRGAVMVLGGIDNAQSLEDPARPSAQSRIDWIKVYPACRVLNTVTDIIQDENSKYFEDFETLRISRIGLMDGGKAGEFKVHRSRCILSKGITVPRDNSAMFEFKYLYWGMSRMQAVFKELANNDTASLSFASMMKEYSIALMKIQGLREMLSNEDTASQELQSLMNIVARSKSVLNMVLLADGDEVSRDTLNTSGWRDAKMMFREELCAVTEIPVPRLFGIPSAGLGGGGADDQATRTYYDSVRSEQAVKLRPILRQIVALVAPSVGMPADSHFVFNPLFEPTEKEIVDMRKVVADTDKIYEEIGALDAFTEIRESRFGGTSYSRETKLDPSMKEEDLAPVPLVTKLPVPAVPGPKPVVAPTPAPPKKAK